MASGLTIRDHLCVEQFAREDVVATLKEFGVVRGWRAITTDATEEVILLTEADYAKVDVRELTLALMNVFPHQVAVVPRHEKWRYEPI